MALTALAGGVLVSSWGVGPVGAAPKPTHAKPVTAKAKGVKGGAARTEYAQSLRKSAAGSEQDGGPATAAKGPVAVLLELDTPATAESYRASLGGGRAAAKAAARAQLGRVKALQGSVEARVRAVAPRSYVLYATHSVLAAVAVQTDAKSVAALRGLGGVKAVYPIAAKHVGNAGAVPLLGAPAVWQALGDLGQDVSVGVIDTGLDYTHSDFGGPGTTAAFNAVDRTHAVPGQFPTAKVIGGFDFAGDDYNANPDTLEPPDGFPYQPVPHPDPNPIDCRYGGPDSTVGHGTHVSGSLAGYGVNADGSVYTGAYNSSTPFGAMRVGPGMAPRASLYALRVFGCAGSSDVVGEALSWAADPNQDGDPSDRLDVVNMSLGSDFGSPQDGDSILSNRLALGGTVVVASIGNGGDLYDVGGSPGNAQRVLAAAASDDGFAVLDALRVTSPASVDGDYPAEQSVAFPWATSPDTTGTLADLPGTLDPNDLSVNNKDGCTPLTPAQAAAVSGKIAWLEWTDDAVRRCGSSARGKNVLDAGAVGAVYADDRETFSAGITGRTEIPIVMVVKSAADTIRPHLAENVSATMGNTLHNTVRQNLPELTDTLSDFSSRGTHVAGNVKPDVAAVGQAVFSVDAGSGNEGKTLSGTSMASPMTAGLAALVRSKHPDWTPEEVKADIMNTAGQDVFTGPGHTGDAYGPNRVGAGRIQATQALSNHVLAYVVNNPGAVSVSFGPVAVTQADTELTKTVKVVNKGLTTAAFSLAYQPLTSVPGVQYTLSTSTVSIDPRSSKTFTVRLKVPDPAALTKTIDPTVEAAQFGLPRQFLADASGRIVLTATDSDRPSLRVPVYSAPRPAAAMTTPSEVRLPAGGLPSADLPLLGHGVAQGAAAARVLSIVSGYALEGTSGRLGGCTATIVEHCISVPEDHGIDLRYVGVTSDAPAVRALGGDPIADSLQFFAVSTWGAWRTPAGVTSFRVDIDTDRNGVPDEQLITTRFTDTDIMVTVLQDVATGDFLADEQGNDAWFLNGLPGAVDTDIFDSDSLVLPVATQAIAATSLDPAHPRVAPGHSRINYGVFTTSGYHNLPVDMVGFTAAGRPALTVDVTRPALTATDGVSADQFYADLPGLPLSVRKDVTSYRTDKTLGLLLVHHHNTDGVRAQVVKVKQPSAARLTLSARTVRAGAAVLAAVSIPASAGPPATGQVTIKYGSAGVVVARGTTTSGYFARNLRLSHGVYVLYADYSGDSNYLAGRSNLVVLQVV